MGTLADYRLRIKSLLSEGDIEQALLREGVSPVIARAVGSSKAVSAQKSLQSSKECE